MFLIPPFTLYNHPKCAFLSRSVCFRVKKIKGVTGTAVKVDAHKALFHVGFHFSFANVLAKC